MNGAPYTPKAGSLAHRVLSFMAQNPDEELTRSDIATKFGCAPGGVDSQLNVPTLRGALTRKRNSDMELVWCLGQSTDFALEQAGSFEAPRASPFPTAAPVILDLSAIKVRKGVRLLSAEERRRAEFAAWFDQFGVGDSAEFDDIHTPTIRAESKRHAKATGRTYKIAATGPGRSGVERTA